LPEDASGQPALPPGVVDRVAFDGVELVLGDPGGMEIVALADRWQASRELVEAVGREPVGSKASSPAAESLEDALADASSVTGRIERALALFIDVAQGRRDLTALGEEADALLGLLERLDREKRLQEALRVARTLAMLLALLQRWVELVGSLRTALSAARELLDESGQAWALHELGALHLLAKDLPAADSMLDEAHKMRERIGERRATALTERNLGVLCHTLRGGLHGQDGEGVCPPPHPSLARMLAFSIVPLLIGGAAGALIGSSGGPGPVTTTTQSFPSVPSAHISIIPSSPRVGESVAFEATLDRDVAHDSFLWSFGDGARAAGASPRHVYRDAAAYTASVTVQGADGKTVARATRTIHVPARSNGGNGGATYTVSLEKAGEGAGTIESRDRLLDCGNDCSHPYEEGTVLTLTATPEEGSTFAGWGGACTGEGPCQLTMSADKSVTATFDRRTATLTVATAGEGKGAVSSNDGRIGCGSTCSASYPDGTEVSLTATPAEGFVFVGWTGACSGVGSCKLTLGADASVTAGFESPGLR
jgi:PKD repeat protein